MQRTRRELGVIRWTCTAAAACALACAAQAQPAQLRLAKSLCTSMTGQVLTSQQVPPLAGTANAQNGANDALARQLDAQREAWFARLDALQPFSGLYATAQADQSFLDNNGQRYAFGLEWELFDQGRDESRRQLERLKLENKAQYLQLARDVEQRQLQENLLAIEQMRSQLLALLYRREAQAAQPVLERRRQQLSAGRITRADLAEIEYKAERAALRSAHHAGTPQVLVYPQALELINRIESVVLKPDAQLVDLALSRSPEYQMQSVLAQRSEFVPSVRDNLSVRFYLERSKDFERGPQNAAGVRLRVPIGNDVGRDEVIGATRELYAQQQQSLRAAVAQKLALLAERLRLKQNDMRVLQAENTLVRRKAELSCYRLDFPVTAIASDPDREVEELTLLLHEKQREILTARLDVLEVLTQISALVKPREPQELYSLSAP